MKDKDCDPVPNAKDVKFYECPSGVGMHVSIDKHNLGQKVGFRIERVMTYENQKMGSSSTFDSSKYVCHWIALRVVLDDDTVQLVSSTHISIAAVGLQGKFQFKEKTKGKKKK